ncbi:hypothetical protein CPB83DRAFT_930010 [Crepidotus variabilis]|uniref:Uncharacterized protein n=1 Tax=Crepidotus variabilis TaxID=179855 RepID=A0A9P6JQB9_9AGAR|nr:hypothetical protein CPB83DRAFT_930010 [Crepidotus variabilis]
MPRPSGSKQAFTPRRVFFCAPFTDWRGRRRVPAYTPVACVDCINPLGSLLTSSTTSTEYFLHRVLDQVYSTTVNTYKVQHHFKKRGCAGIEMEKGRRWLNGLDRTHRLPFRLPDGARGGSLEAVLLKFALSHPEPLALRKRSKTPQMARKQDLWPQAGDRTRLASNSDHLVDLAFSSMPLAEDLEPPPAPIFTQDATLRLTNAPGSSIQSSDLALLHSLLFSPHIPASSPSALYLVSVPLLVNAADAKGWSPIHHHWKTVGEANDQCNAIVIHFRSRIEEASRMVQELQGYTDRIGSLRNAIQLAARGKLLVRELTPLPSRWRNKDSEDSQATYVCHDGYSDTAPSIQASTSFTPRGHISQATQTALLDQFGAKPAYPCSPAKTDPPDHSKLFKTEQTYFDYIHVLPDL